MDLIEEEPDIRDEFHGSSSEDGGENSSEPNTTGDNRDSIPEKVSEDRQEPDPRHLLDPRRVLEILKWRRKILGFVESMMEAEIKENDFRSGEGLICQRDYDCIVQERYLTKLCGYPLCSNKLTKEWKQRFHVSLKDRRIYDVEVRKLYCSAKCMDISVNYKKDNLPEEPIWMNLDNLHIDPNFETQKSNP